LSGIARRVKEEVPNCRIVGVDPVGSLLAGPSPIGSYKVEGIGYDFIPDVLDRDLVDEWVKTEDRESFLMARRLIRKEGMLVGGSAGSAVWAAVQMGKKYGPGKRIVTLAPDSVRNYMTKFLDDGWMRANGFADRSWEAASVAELLRTLPRRELVTAEHGHTVSEAVKLMKSQGISQLPVVEDGRLVGILTESDVLGKLVDGRATLASKVAEVMFRNVRTVEESDDVGLLSKIFNEGLVAVVIGEDRALKGIVTKLDLVDFLTRSTG
jgi:cystathionine beta-synthase